MVIEVLPLFASSPIYYRQILSVDKSQKYNLSSVRQATSAGVALPFEIIEYWRKNFNIPIYEALGMTEMSTFISSGELTPIKEGKIGKIQPGRKVAILPLINGETPVPVNEIGILSLHKSNPGFMLGYLHPERNKAVFRGEWFLTGDLVSMDGEGYIQHHGRHDDALVVPSGETINPSEVEAIFSKHPNIADVACTLTTEKISRNVLTAFIVLRDKSQNKEEDKKNILTFIKNNLISEAV